MQQYLEHPTEEALERFLLNQFQEEELEVLETHILACEPCVARLEWLENQIATTKIALEKLQQNSSSERSAAESRSWKTWFTIPRLSWAGAVAALALGIALVPHFTSAPAPVQVSLSAYRDNGSTVVPEGRPLHLDLNAADLGDGSVIVQLVNEQGVQIWKGSGAIQGDRTNANLPQIKEAGNYFLRLYGVAKDSSTGNLLREFTIRVQ